MDKWMVRFDERDCWWYVCDKRGRHVTGMFSSRQGALDHCRDLNEKQKGEKDALSH